MAVKILFCQLWFFFFFLFVSHLICEGGGNGSQDKNVLPAEVVQFFPLAEVIILAVPGRGRFFFFLR